MVDIFLAAFCDISGIGILYASWRGYWSRQFFVPMAWLLLGLSCVFWIRAVGAEFGIAYTFLTIAICAWFVVGFNFKIRSRQLEKPRVQALNLLPSNQAIVKNLLLFVLVVPLAGTSSIFLSVVLVHMLPLQDVNALVTGIVIMPVIWGLASYWACADTKPLRPGLALVFCGLFCALYIYG